MPPRSFVNVRDTTGALLEVITAWEGDQGLSYSKVLDGVGTYSLTLSLDSPQTKAFTKDCFIEVIRSDVDNGIGPYTDFIGMHRDKEYKFDANNNRLYISHGVTPEHLLTRRHMLYFTGDPLAAQNAPADDAMKSFVDLNMGPSATAPPRIKDGVFPNVVIAPAVGLGPLWSGERSFQVLFDVIHEIALAATNTAIPASPGVDFNIVVGWGPPLTLTFTTYYPYLGFDRRQGSLTATPAVFTPQIGNMGTPSYTEVSANEKTTVVVLGQGSGVNREFVIVQDAEHLTESPWNDIEITIDKRQDGLIQSLDDAGAAELQHVNTKRDFNMTVLRNKNLVYKKDWDFGDAVTADFLLGDGPLDRRISGMNVTIKAEGEQVQPILSELS